MIRTISSPQGSSNAILLPGILLLIGVSGTLWYFCHPARPATAPPAVYATTTAPGGLAIDYEVTTTDVSVDWDGGGDFDPRDKCPRDFFGAGFVVLCKRLADGAYVKFLYHKGRRLLYRIDKDVIKGRARVGLHWVEGTRFGARYRIADPAFKGGKMVDVPTARGGTTPRNFRYGEAVSKTRVQPRRELFRETHIRPGDCPEWWDVLDFLP